MTVTDVLEYLAGGMTQEEILAEFPDLTSEDIKACLAFAADRERKLATLPHYETAVLTKTFHLGCLKHLVISIQIAFTSEKSACAMGTTPLSGSTRC